ncbi:MAG TPA: O-antigen ligase family protein [Flavobacteriales bacterium]
MGSWPSPRFLRTGLQTSLLALCAYPLWPLSVGGALVVPLLLFAVTLALRNPEVRMDRERTLLLLTFLALPLFYLTELFTADDPAYVWRIVQRKLALVLVPLAVYLGHRGGFVPDRRRCFDALVAAMALLMVWAVGALAVQGLDAEQLANGGWAFAFRTRTEELTGLHPTYFGLLTAFAVMVLLHRIVEGGEQRMLRIASLVLIALFVGFLLLLAARMAVVALLLAMLVLVLRGPWRAWHKAAVVAVSAMVLVGAIVAVPSLRERMREVMGDGSNSTRDRLYIHSCAMGVAKSYWLTGVSVEKLQPSLDLCYAALEAPDTVLEKHYNTHNEYLNILCGKGIVGLLLFAALLFLLVRRGWRDPLLLSFCILFATVCLTEDLLERQIGVFFFSVFGAVLGMRPSASEAVRPDQQ